ncbi:hypothetical protein ACWD26_21115 [Streptomyces sp. NPDC002787]
MSRTSRRTLAALTLLSAAVVLSTTACSSSGGNGAADEQPVRAASPSPAKATPAAVSDEADADVEADASEVSVDRAPDLNMDGRIVLRQNRTQGSASLEFGEAKKGDGEALTVAVECEGKGRIEVVLRSVGASFPMECLDGEVTGIANVFAVEGAAGAGTVSVTSPSNVHWSLSIGRSEPTEQDLS